MFGFLYRGKVMIISSIEKTGKYKSLIKFDDGRKLVLKTSEAESLNLEENSEMPEEIYERILSNIIYPRAKEKVIRLLSARSRTMTELADRLKRDYYDESVIDKIEEWVNEYNFVNDDNYIYQYYMSNKGKKGMCMMEHELSNKGISKEAFRNYLEKNDIDSDEEEVMAIKKLCEKIIGIDMEYNEKQKHIAKLVRKGFWLGNIKKVL